MISAIRAHRTVGWLAAGVAVVGAFFIVGIIARVVSPTPSGPALSAYATTPHGVAAWAELLSRDGHSVRELRNPAARGELPATATLVILSADATLTASETRALQHLLNRGGRVILGGPVGAVATKLHGAVVAVSNPTFLENGGLGVGDNALRALMLAGPADRPVYFDETVHGFGPASGLAALPERWWFAIVGFGLALLAWALSKAAALGGSDPVPVQRPAPRTAYIEAMGRTLTLAERGAELGAQLSEATERETAFRCSSMSPRSG